MRAPPKGAKETALGLAQRRRRSEVDHTPVGSRHVTAVDRFARGRKHKHRIGDVGFHHYAFELRSRRDVDELQSFLKELGARIVDPAAEYYDDYYAVFFLDPDGLKLEGMKYGEAHAAAKRTSRRAGKADKAKSRARRTADG